MAPPPTRRTCAECGCMPADVPIIDDAGAFDGYLCDDCDRKRRRRRMGWSRRCARRLRRWLQL